MLSERKLTKIKNDILGKGYQLSTAFVSEKKSQELNKKYRRKNKPTNVLSFALKKNSGELVLCLPVIRREAKELGQKPEEWLGFLVIHGMLHLKGHVHSSTMEKAEKQYDQKYFGGHRSRVLHDAGSGGRIHKRRKKS